MRTLANGKTFHDFRKVNNIMRSRNLLLLCAVLVIALCGTALAKLADDMTISGNFAKGYTVNNWYSSYITVSGGVTDYTFNITEGELPPGFFIR